MNTCSNHSLQVRIGQETLGKHLSSADILHLAEALEFLTFTDGYCIVRQKSVGEVFYIIYEGTVRIEVDDIEVGILQAGEYFGERALLRFVVANIKGIFIMVIIVWATKLYSCSFHPARRFGLPVALPVALYHASCSQRRISSNYLAAYQVVLRCLLNTHLYCLSMIWGCVVLGRFVHASPIGCSLVCCCHFLSCFCFLFLLPPSLSTHLL